MVQTCSKCSRINPDGAQYCFHDGFALGEAGRRGGPLAAGARLFPGPFVFPDGRSCRNFDELAMACQSDWDGARSMLAEGYLERFLGGIGRVDLALAAREAARFPDPDRGLDQLLAKLPTEVLQDAKLRVEPAEVNLGLLEGDRVRSFELRLENQGMRLLYGRVSSSDAWLTFGEAPGTSEKHFHFTQDCRLLVHVWPAKAQARTRPLEARLLVESNTGPVTVKIRCEKLVKPFPEAGPLQGCKTPRHVAEKAQASPRDAAPFFESGQIEKWYASNGWVYPVTIPTASGVASVQQFFEALGVTKAPKVEISTREINLEGEIGANLPFRVVVSTQEKRPVFAHAVSNAPWIEVERIKLSGKAAEITARVTVPDLAGQSLTGELEVTSNGKQRFRLPVQLNITGNPVAEFDFTAPAAPPVRPSEIGGLGNFPSPPIEQDFDFAPKVAPPLPLPLAPVLVPQVSPSVAPRVPPPIPASAAPVLPAAPFAEANSVTQANSVAQADSVAPSTAIAEPVMDQLVATTPDLTDWANGTAEVSPRQSKKRRGSSPPPKTTTRKEKGKPNKHQRSGGSGLLHLIPAVLLVAAVAGVIVYDHLYPPTPESDSPSSRAPRVAIPGPAYDPGKLADTKPRVGVTFNPDNRFGVVMLTVDDPQDSGKNKRLTAYENGSSNNTIVRIGNSDYTFGFTTPNNRWLEQKKPLPRPYTGWISTMEFASEQVRVTQYVQLVPGGGTEGVLDTVLIYYWATNHGTIPRKVAIRLMLDTYIGKNDGVPFTVPGKSGFVTQTANYEKSDVPDFLEVVENPNDAKNPGTIARLGLRGLSWGEIELLEPQRVLISRWPGQSAKWDWEPMPMKDDSSVAVYWPEVKLEAKKSMHLAVTYGLGKLDITDQLALSAPAAVQPGRGFVVTAYVYNTSAGQKVKLELPPGLRLEEDTPLEQEVPEAAKRTQLFWKVRPSAEGKYLINATSEKSRAKSIKVAVQARSIFG